MKNITATERFEKSYNRESGADLGELREELVGFCESRDSDGIVRLIQAYVGWELRNPDSSETEEEIINRVKSNLDYIARVADQITIGGKEGSYVRALKMPISVHGLVTEFFRDTIGYHPFDPSTN